MDQLLHAIGFDEAEITYIRLFAEASNESVSDVIRRGTLFFVEEEYDAAAWLEYIRDTEF